MANPGSTAALPYDLNPVDGWEERFVPVDKCDFICYPGFRGCIFRTDAVALSGTGAGVFSPTFAQLLGEVVIEEGFTGTITLPATTEWYRYLTRIKCFFPSNDDPDEGELRRWWVEERFANMSDLNVTINSQAGTTFPDGTTSFALPPGISVFRLRPLTGGLAPTMILEPESGAALITTFCDLPTYPLPGNDDDEIIICNSGVPENISRENFINFTGVANNAILGPNSNYAMSGGGNTGLGEDSFAAVTTGFSNVAIGFNSSLTLTSGSTNTTVGINSGNELTTGSGNTYLGANSGAITTPSTGSNNTAVGLSALSQVTTGSDNVAMGRDALDDLTTGGTNVGVGLNAGNALTTGSSNVYIGNAAGPNGAASTASQNIAIGSNALDAVTTGTPNIAMGENALGALTTGANNIAIGSGAADALTTGANNIAISQNALGAATTDSSNIAIGISSLLVLNGSTGGNVSVGTQSGVAMTTGSANSLYGAGAGQDITTGTNNICIGFQGGDAITTGSNNTVLGNNSGGVGTASNLTTQSNVIMVGVGISATPMARSTYIGDAIVTNAVASPEFFITPGLPVTADPTLLYNTNGRLSQPASSRVFKTEVEEIDLPLEIIDKIIPKQYNFNDVTMDKEGKLLYSNPKPRYGFIADEIGDLAPRLVRHGAPAVMSEKEGYIVPLDEKVYKYKDIDDRAMIAYLWKVVRHLKAEVEELKAKA